jgi:hypothetical protein
LGSCVNWWRCPWQGGAREWQVPKPRHRVRATSLGLGTTSTLGAARCGAGGDSVQEVVAVRHWRKVAPKQELVVAARAGVGGGNIAVGAEGRGVDGDSV